MGEIRPATEFVCVSSDASLLEHGLARLEDAGIEARESGRILRNDHVQLWIEAPEPEACRRILEAHGIKTFQPDAPRPNDWRRWLSLEGTARRFVRGADRLSLRIGHHGRGEPPQGRQ